MRRNGWVIAVLVIAAGVGGCGSSGSSDATKTVTVKQTTVIEKAPAPVKKQGSSQGAGSNVDAGDSGRIVVPNEVGRNHQDAQDDLQSKGLYNLDEKDATGQGRLLILDSNWKVVSQTPAAGTRVGPDTTITLSSKKYTDP